MKIAILHYSSPPIVGGVESVLAHHALMMADVGHQVTILAGRGETFDLRISLRCLPHFDSRDHKVMKLKALLDEGKYTPQFDRLRNTIEEELSEAVNGMDVLIVHNAASLHKNLPLTAAIHAAYRKPGFPRLILWHHDLAWTTPRYRRELHPGYPWDLLRTAWPKAAQVVISEQRRKELSDLYGIDRESIRVIPNGVEFSSFFKLEAETVDLIHKLDLLIADPLLLLPVRLTPRKNIELAIQVMAELRKHYPRARLLVTGPEGPHNPANAAYKQKLLALRNALNVQEGVNFLAEVKSGFLPDAVIADFYRLADGLLFPSREEGFGIPIIEAAFSSIPVFCADIPVLRELGGGDVTYFATNGDPRTIAEQIIRRLEAEMTSRWARRAKQNYSWGSIYRNQIEPLLKEVMHENFPPKV